MPPAAMGGRRRRTLVLLLGLMLSSALGGTFLHPQTQQGTDHFHSHDGTNRINVSENKLAVETHLEARVVLARRMVAGRAKDTKADGGGVCAGEECGRQRVRGELDVGGGLKGRRGVSSGVRSSSHTLFVSDYHMANTHPPRNN